MKKSNFLKVVMALSLVAILSLASCSFSPAGSGPPQQPGSGASFKVGIITFMDHASLNQIEENIQYELDRLGDDLGVTFDYEDYTACGQGDGSTLQAIAAQMVADQVDVIVPIATPAVQTAMAVTEDTDIPIIFAAVSDPITDGIVADLNAPGGRVTGTSDALDTKAVINLMLAVNPDIQKVGLLYSKSENSSAKSIEEAKAILADKKIAVVEKTGTNTDEIASAADALIAAQVDAVFTPTDNTVQSAELSIYEKFLTANIPHYGGADSFALNGAFCGYGVDYVQLGQETAQMVVGLLVNGADPATTPVRIMAGKNATINIETCTALGMDLDTVSATFSELGIGVVETLTQYEFFE